MFHHTYNTILCTLFLMYDETSLFLNMFFVINNTKFIIHYNGLICWARIYINLNRRINLRLTIQILRLLVYGHTMSFKMLVILRLLKQLGSESQVYLSVLLHVRPTTWHQQRNEFFFYKVQSEDLSLIKVSWIRKGQIYLSVLPHIRPQEWHPKKINFSFIKYKIKILCWLK